MKKAILILVALFVSTISLAQTTIRVADDSSSGTYKKMLGEIAAVCNDGDILNIVEASGVAGGAPGNLEALVNNKADAAFLHSDVYEANKNSDPTTYSRIQTLVALYPEPIHILALRQSKTSKLGTLSFGKQDFNTLADAKGFKVGAAGGGVFTARIMTGQGEGGFTVVPYDKGSDVISALDNGDIALAIFVGAAPLPNIEKLSNKANYKLIPVGEIIGSRVQGLYRPVSINYNGITNGPVKTLAPVATIMTRKFSTPTKVEAQVKFRSCFNAHVPDLQDTGSPNWQDVKVGDQGVLPWLELPAATTQKASKGK